ncbi:MAG: hypothetical protein C4520_09805 [Candidatus Abyssobacteria bacterium SURF_5]|uniref:Right handed beta helix domain-containing protein n=1 Tax=Abyssobacteria bacterium (strain SURF_5) TaxID=2093360 RepID=A0A3A4NQZ3_ABYX5|nr:MAG: hypothetical protein C4520_09805 [Candidatus Abyssubacteria bacterium SURF_5]
MEAKLMKHLVATPLAIISWFLFFAASAPAGIIHVPADFITLQSALDAAANNDIVLVADGTYNGPNNKDLDFRGKSITLRSQNGPVSCVIDCEGEGRGFSFTGGGNQLVDGFTVLNGSADGGGATYIDTGSSAIIRNCRFIGNAAYLGGALYVDGASPIISGCTFSDNVAFFHGGAIYAADAAVTVENSAIIANESLVGGGGMTFFFSSSDIINCIIGENLTDSYGGGIDASHSTLTLTSSTIRGNSAWEAGGGVAFYDSNAVLSNCILWQDSAWEGDEIYLWEQSSVSVEYSDVMGGAAAAKIEIGSTLEWADGNLDADPLFADGPLGDYYLSQLAAGQSADSPCVDAGSDTAEALGLDAYTTRTDHQQDGGMVDMGYHYSPLTEILLLLPAAGETLSEAPFFCWTADGETNNVFAVEIKIGNSPWHSTYKDLKLVLDQTSWTMPESIWAMIPSGRTISWRVRGMDLGRDPKTAVTSIETRTIYKP